MVMSDFFLYISCLSHTQVTNRYELARLLAKDLNLDMSKVKSGLSSESGLNRPQNLSLDTTLIKNTLQTTVLRGISERLGRR